MNKKQSISFWHITAWMCCTCKRWKASSDFYGDNRTSNGLKAQCKKCHTKTSISSRNVENHLKANRLYMRRARKKNPEKFRERERLYKNPYDNKVSARNILNAAVKRGDIKKPKTCRDCGCSGRITAHHNDYSRPLDVEWLCYVCHGIKTRTIRLGG